MSGLDKTIINFSTGGVPVSGALAVTASSVSAALPAGIELLMLTTTGNGHFRLGVGAQTALVTDPMVTAGICLVVKLNPSLTYTLAVISDAVIVASGTLSYTQVFEG